MSQRTLLASAVRAATNTTADQTRVTETGLHIIINMIAVPGVDTVTCTLQGQDSLGNYYTILASAAIVATGVTVLRVIPGVTVAANLAASDSIPDVWRINCTHSAGTNFTYTVTVNTLGTQ